MFQRIMQLNKLMRDVSLNVDKVAENVGNLSQSFIQFKNMPEAREMVERVEYERFVWLKLMLMFDLTSDAMSPFELLPRHLSGTF